MAIYLQDVKTRMEDVSDLFVLNLIYHLECMTVIEIVTIFLQDRTNRNP